MSHLATLVLGAGPAGLAVAVHLALTDPGAVRGDRFAVVDPSGGWLGTWRRQMAAQRITHLRSPVVHHPHPSPFALLRTVDQHAELIRPDGIDLPTTSAFERFCDALVDRCKLGRAVIRSRAVGATSGAGATQVRLASGACIEADRVVVTTNPQRPVLPPWTGDVPRDRLHPGGRLSGDDLHGRRVVVVGGGLSAAHLALGACESGADVTLLARRHLVERRMDIDPAWLGPGRMGPFAAATPAERRRMVDAARGGGSIPAYVLRRLRRAAGRGLLRLREADEVVAVVDVAGATPVLRTAGGCALPADEVWTATGSAVDVTVDPVLSALCAQHPVPVHDGVPELREDLRWGRTPVWVAGAAAALQLGPVASNLYGHRVAGSRIARSLTGRGVLDGVAA